MQPQFIALNGEELKTVILDRISKAIDFQGSFKPHLAFPLVKFTATINVWTYPEQSLEGTPGVVIKVSEGNEEVNKAVVTTMTVGDIIDTPDKARVETGIPIPETKKPEPKPDKPISLTDLRSIKGEKK